MSKYIKKLESPCVVRFADRQGHFRHTLVCGLGRKYARLVWIDSSVGGQGIRIHRVLLESVLRYSRPLEEIYIYLRKQRRKFSMLARY